MIHLSKLKVLYFSSKIKFLFLVNNITNVGCKMIASSFRFISKLESLSLACISSCYLLANPLCDEGFLFISNNINYLHHLNTIDLCSNFFFYLDTRITDCSVNLLTKNLDLMPELSNINISCRINCLSRE